MSRPTVYPAELRQRAIRMVAEVRPNYESEWAAIGAVAQKLGIGSSETLRAWIRRAQVDAGQRPGVTSEEAAEIKRLRRENAELRRGVNAGRILTFTHHRGSQRGWRPSGCAEVGWVGVGEGGCAQLCLGDGAAQQCSAACRGRRPDRRAEDRWLGPGQGRRTSGSLMRSPDRWERDRNGSTIDIGPGSSSTICDHRDRAGAGSR
jgi:transposase